MRLTIAGLPGAVMWSGAMPRARAARTIAFTMAADRVEPLRVYVVAPPQTAPQKFSFVLTATDAEGGGDASEVRFDAPQGDGR
jgi:hypothetical protein